MGWQLANNRFGSNSVPAPALDYVQVYAGEEWYLRGSRAWRWPTDF
jgi:hypothetical protein